MIEKTYIRGSWHYNMENVEAAVCRDAGPCQFRLLLPQTDFKLVDDVWMSQNDLLKFLDWYGETAPSSYLHVIGGIAKAVKQDKKKSRAVSRKFRWHVAFSQSYTCGKCKELLHPDAFDIDHKVELRAGGLDRLENLVALCTNCHAKKTRSYHRNQISK